MGGQHEDPRPIYHLVKAASGADLEFSVPDRDSHTASASRAAGALRRGSRGPRQKAGPHRGLGEAPRGEK